MSWFAQGTTETELDRHFETNYPEPDAGVREQFEACKVAVKELLKGAEEEVEQYRFSGHVHQGEGSARSTMTVSVDFMLPNEGT